MRLKYTIGRVILVFVSPLLCHSLLSLRLEAKLILMAISPTIATMEPHKLRFRLGMGFLSWFFSTWLLNWFLLTTLLTLFPKEHFSRSAHKLDRLLEIICLWGKHGWSWGCV
jgi:Zn-dependent protease with chaperone function